jgi:putative restriction endonuclease
MFDRGVISVDDDGGILIAKNRLPDTVIRLLRDDRRLLPPKQSSLRPHIHFLRCHREHIFKG